MERTQTGWEEVVLAIAVLGIGFLILIIGFLPSALIVFLGLIPVALLVLLGFVVVRVWHIATSHVPHHR